MGFLRRGHWTGKNAVSRFMQSQFFCPTIQRGIGKTNKGAPTLPFGAGLGRYYYPREGLPSIAFAGKTALFCGGAG